MEIPKTLPWSRDKDQIIENDGYNLVSSYDSYIDEDIAEYIIQTANNFPKAIELLKKSLEVLSDFNSEPEDEIRSFLKSLENE